MNNKAPKPPAGEVISLAARIGETRGKPVNFTLQNTCSEIDDPYAWVIEGIDWRTVATESRAKTYLEGFARGAISQTEHNDFGNQTCYDKWRESSEFERVVRYIGEWVSERRAKVIQVDVPSTIKDTDVRAIAVELRWLGYEATVYIEDRLRIEIGNSPSCRELTDDEIADINNAIDRALE